MAEQTNALTPPGPPFTSWQRIGLQPDTGLYIQRADQLYLQIRSDDTWRWHLVVRLQVPETGDIVPQHFQGACDGTRAPELHVLNLAEGFLVGLALFLEDATATEGAAWAEVGLLRGGADALARAHVLVSGYLGGIDGLGYPAADVRPASRTRGRLVVQAQAAPAAGVESIITVPTDVHWLVRTWRATLTTDATVVNRQVHLVVDDGTNILCDVPANAVQAASLVRNYNGAAFGGDPAATDAEIYVALPVEVNLRPAWRFRTLTTNLQAADQWSIARLVVEEELQN